MDPEGRLIVPESSLVKYKSPVRVSDWNDAEWSTTTKPESKHGRAAKPVAGAIVGAGAVSNIGKLGASTAENVPTKRTQSPTSEIGSEPGGGKGNQQNLIGQGPLIHAARPAETTENILRSIMPPKRFQLDKSLFVQEVSSCPASRIDVVQLTSLLDTQLEARGAKMTGICPIRRELFTQVFDELIRQMTIQCAERGLLLLRVRNEVGGTLAALQSIYASGVVFGLQKCLAREADRYRQESCIQQLEGELAQLRKRVQTEALNIRAIEEKEANRLAAATRRAEEDVAFLRKGHDQLKAQFEENLAQFKVQMPG